MMRIATMALAAIMGVALPAAGQGGGPGFRDAPELSSGDSRLLWDSVHAVLATYATGSTRAWTSADGKRAGTATLLGTFNRDTMRCADVQHAFTHGPGTTYTFPFCEMRDGSWKIAP